MLYVCVVLRSWLLTKVLKDMNSNRMRISMNNCNEIQSRIIDCIFNMLNSVSCTSFLFNHIRIIICMYYRCLTIQKFIICFVRDKAVCIVSTQLLLLENMIIITGIDTSFCILLFFRNRYLFACYLSSLYNILPL